MVFPTKSSLTMQLILWEKILNYSAKSLRFTTIDPLHTDHEMNGVVEAANKNLKKILQKMTANHSNWHEMLPYALMAYRTSIRTSTGATPYSLVYGMEAVLPIEVEIPSLRVLAEAKILESAWAQVRHDQLNLIDEKRLQAMSNGQAYRRRMAITFNKRVRPRDVEEGDLVLKKVLPHEQSTTRATSAKLRRTFHCQTEAVRWGTTIGKHGRGRLP